MRACRFAERTRCIVAAFGLVVAAHVHAARQTLCPGFYGHDDTKISRVLLPDDTPESWKRPCSDEECKATRDIECAADAYAHRLTPNTMGYRSPREARQEFERYGRNIQALGQEHPGRIPLYCKLLARVAVTIAGENAHDPSTANRDWTAVNVIDMAIRLDLPGNHCLADVVAAAPKSQAVQGDADVVWAKHCLRHINFCQRHLDPPLR